MIRYLVEEMQNAVDARDIFVATNEQKGAEELLQLFAGQPETYHLNRVDVKHFLGYATPNLKSVLRLSRNEDPNNPSFYTPATAAMSLVLRAGVEKNAKVSWDLIQEIVAKVNKSI